MKQYNLLQDAILDYIETRDSNSLHNVLQENIHLLEDINVPIYRGFTALQGSLEVGEKIYPHDFVMSWTTNIEIAEYFARYNKELIKYEDVVLEDLCITSNDVDDLIKPMIIQCDGGVKGFTFNNHIDQEDITDETMRNEDGVVVLGDSVFEILEVNPFKFNDNQEGYIVKVRYI